MALPKAKKVVVAIATLCLVVVCLALVVDLKAQANRAALLGRGDYRLAQTDGGTFSRETLKGAPFAVFFGFTHCPDICPTTLGEVALWRQDLPAARDLKVFFVTVDPERDSLDDLAAYTSWVPGVVGVRGSQEQTAKVLASFQILAQRIYIGNGDYTMAHTSFMLLFDENGVFVEVIPYGSAPEEAVGKLANLMAGNPAGRGARLPSDPVAQLCFSVQEALL
ncbi:SCO family protein [Oceanicella sp. SM1341]|uniref:SCO family protein n=1 Tax=Oceanicella sp. SM1341 TaxID=1548889 RepID=UPI000E50B55A|nr:SCO family protein [Oceanicella sp. SM1341]